MNGQDEPAELRSGELLAALERHRVQFLVVGGFGAQLHGATRQTKDVDLCPARDDENFDRLAHALAELDARLRLPPELGDVEVPPNGRLLRETTVTHWRTRAGDVDVLIAIAGASCRWRVRAQTLPRDAATPLGILDPTADVRVQIQKWRPNEPHGRYTAAREKRGSPGADQAELRRLVPRATG